MKLRSTIFGVALGIVLPLCAQAEYVGDYAVGTDNICKVFNTYQPSTGASFTAASLAVDIYKDDNTTQDNDSGLTVDDDFDSLTGAHQVCVDTSSDGTFYSAGSMFTVVVSVGTVDSVSIVGTEVMTFSLAKTSALRPTTAGRTLDVSAGGEAGLDWSNIGSPTTSVALSGTTVDLVSGAVDDTAINSAAELQAAAAAALSAYDPPTRAELTTDKAEIMSMLGQKTTITGLSTQAVFNLSAGSADDDAYNGWGALVIDASTAGQTSLGVVSDYAGSTKTVTLCADPGVFTVANSDVIVLIPARLDCGEADATIAKLDDTLEDDSGTYRFTTNALEQGPSGAASEDWTEDERTAMRTILGIPGSGTTPDDPTDGILDDIRDSVATRASQTSVDTLDQNVDDIESRLGTPSDLGSGATVAGNLSDIEGQTDDIGVAGAGLTAIDLPDQTMNITGSITGNLSGSVGSVTGAVTVGTNNDKTGYSLTVTPPTAVQISTQVLSDQRILTGTCDSGSTTTCVDNALTQADETQIDDRLICFDDSWCALITGFTPSSDTVTTTKTAPSTRASKAYTIFPATSQ